MSVKVTIIITCYNKEEFVREAIDSALQQTYSDFELLIVNDGSTDNSLSIINEYRGNKNLTIVNQENIGIIQTRNKAIHLAKGEYVLQLDADDKLHHDYLTWTVPILDKNKSIGIAYCNTRKFGEVNEDWLLPSFSIEEELQLNLIVITALFRKSDFLKTSGYNEVFSKGLEDWDFWLSLLELGVGVERVEKIGFYYRILPNSRNNSYLGITFKALRRTIFMEHQELYFKHNLDPVNLLWDMKVKDQKLQDLKVYKESAEYKIGKMILYPFRLLQKKLRGN